MHARGTLQHYYIVNMHGGIVKYYTLCTIDALLLRNPIDWHPRVHIYNIRIREFRELLYATRLGPWPRFVMFVYCKHSRVLQIAASRNRTRSTSKSVYKNVYTPHGKRILKLYRAARSSNREVRIIFPIGCRPRTWMRIPPVHYFDATPIPCIR